MGIAFTSLLVLHIVAGSIGLLTGTINLVRRKGDRPHGQIGQMFFYAMSTTGISAVLLAVLHPNSFLAIVGIFTIYMVGTGYRYIRLRLRKGDNEPKAFDWVLTVGMGIVAIVFLFLGGRAVFGGITFGVVFIIFGFVGLLFVRQDVRNYTGKFIDRNYWLLAHLQRMTGAYIAALTAFLVVNTDTFNLPVPGYVFWLLPTAILTPLIIIWSRRYQVKREL